MTNKIGRLVKANHCVNISKICLIYIYIYIYIHLIDHWRHFLSTIIFKYVLMEECIQYIYIYIYITNNTDSDI